MGAHKKHSRLYWIDWVRIVSTNLVLLYHGNRFFDLISTDVNLGDSPILENFSRFMSQWLMPIFFFISGYSLVLALQRYSLKDVIKERIKKLIVPGIVGVVLFATTERYISRVHHGYKKSWIEYVVTFFTSAEFSFSQMWFVFCLFLITVLNMPFFLWCMYVKQMADVKKLSLSEIFTNWQIGYIVVMIIGWFGTIGPVPKYLVIGFLLCYVSSIVILSVKAFFFYGTETKDLESGVEVKNSNPSIGILIIVIMALSSTFLIFGPPVKQVKGGLVRYIFHVLSHNTFFIAGFFAGLYQVFDYKKALGFFAFLSIPFLVFFVPPHDGYYHNLRSYFGETERVLFEIGTWYWVTFICYLASALCNFKGYERLFNYLRDSSFTIYLVHNVWLYMFATLLRGQEMAIWIKYTIVQLGTLVLCHVVHWIISLTNVTRFLFGQKLKTDEKKDSRQ